MRIFAVFRHHPAGDIDALSDSSRCGIAAGNAGIVNDPDQHSASPRHGVSSLMFGIMVESEGTRALGAHPLFDRAKAR